MSTAIGIISLIFAAIGIIMVYVNGNRKPKDFIEDMNLVMIAVAIFLVAAAICFR